MALRVDLAYHLGKRNTWLLTRSQLCHPSFIRAASIQESHQSRFEAWMEKIPGELVKRSKRILLRHYHQRHGEDSPIWVAVEVLILAPSRS